MLSLTVTIEDADVEAGIAQARAAYNAGLDGKGTPIGSDEAFAAQMALDSLTGTYAGTMKRLLQQKMQDLDQAETAVIEAVVDAEIAKRPPKPPEEPKGQAAEHAGKGKA